MMMVLLIIAISVAVIAGVALILPCEACRLRRERMKQAIAAWQARQSQHK